MTLSAIRALISLSTILLMGVYYFLNRKNKNRKNISWEVKQGVRCYSCKEEIFNESNIQTELQRETQRLNKLRNIFDRIDIDPKSEDLHMCTSCNRDNQIEGLINKRLISLNSIKNYLYSRKFNRILWGYTIFMITTLILDILDYTTNKDSLRIFFYLYNFTIYCYWGILFYKTRLEYIDK
jgi:hypothetical protein